MEHRLSVKVSAPRMERTGCSDVVSLLGQTTGRPRRRYFFILLCVCLSGILPASRVQMHCNAKNSLESRLLHVTVCPLHLDTDSNALATPTGSPHFRLGINN